MNGAMKAYWIGRMVTANGGSGGGLSSVGEAALIAVLIGCGLVAIGLAIWAWWNS